MVKRWNFISTFKVFFETWSLFYKILNKIRLKAGKLIKSEFQKLYVRRPINRIQGFFITWIFYQLTDLCSNYAIQWNLNKQQQTTNNIFYSLRNQKWDKTNSWSLKYIKNKYEVTLNSFANFAYVSSYLYLKDFAWKRD